MTYLKSLSRRDPDLHSFTHLLCFSENSLIVSFESKNADIQPAFLKDDPKQPPVGRYVNDLSVSERIVLFTLTMCCQLLNHLLGHQIDLLLLVPVRVGSTLTSRSPDAKI